MNEVETFKSRFRFDAGRRLFIGVERERFLTRKQEIIPVYAQLFRNIAARFPELKRLGAGRESNPALSDEIVPECAHVLAEIARLYPAYKDQFVPEFNACVLENKTPPCGSLSALQNRLQEQEDVLSDVLPRLGLGFSFREVAPISIPFVLNTSENERYRKILKTWPLDAVMAVSRIIGVHVHIGAPDHDAALRAYNALVRFARPLVKAASRSGGRRERLYSKVKPGYEPIEYASWEHFYEDALARGFAENPKDNWSMIRITAFGTIEARVFGAMATIEEVCTAAWLCHELIAAEI